MTSNCPFCGSSDTEQLAPWGGQMITSQARCHGCNSYFEVIREATPWTTSYDDDRSEPQPPARCS